MKRVLVFVALLIGGYVRANSPTNSIDVLVQELNSSNGLWRNGGYPIIALSSNATLQEVVSAAVTKWSLDGGQIKTFRILEARKIELKHLPDCSAALIDSNLGKKVLLFRYERPGSWWTRFVDVTEKAEPSAPANGASPRR